MGWLFMPAPRSGKEYLDNQFTFENDKDTVSVLKSAMVGSTYYAAVKRAPKDGTPATVTGIVCLTRRAARDPHGCTWGYKDMSEFSGPNESNCPAGILDLLSPLPESGNDSDKWARAWRDRCRENLALKSKRPKPGDRISLPEPLSFGGVPLSSFTAEEYVRRGKKRLAFRAANGMLCRLDLKTAARHNIGPAPAK